MTMDANKTQLYIAKRPFLSTTIAGKTIRWLIDSGASLTCLSDKLFALFPPEQVTELPLPPELSIQTASGQLFDLKGLYLLPIIIGKSVYKHPVVIIRNLAANAILGTDFLQRANATVDFTTRKITFRKDKQAEDAKEIFTAKGVTVPAHALAWIYCRSEGRGLGMVESEFLSVDAALMQLKDKSFRIRVHNTTDEPLNFRKGVHVGVFSTITKEDLVPLNNIRRPATRSKLPMRELKRKMIDEERNIDGSEDFVKKTQKLLYKFHETVSESTKDLGLTREVEHDIIMRTKEPVHIPQFRIPEEHLEILNKHVDDLLQAGCVIRSSSTFNSPIFLVKKQGGGGLRVIQDFRAINDMSFDNKYSIKEIQECIDTIGRQKSTIFSTVDLRCGFWQMGLKKGSQEQTAFSVPGRGRFQWLVTPMGLKGSPASFQRMMDTVMEGLPHVQVYIDDILIHSPDEASHLIHLQECLARLRMFNLKINLKKCFFGRKEVPYLGHILTKDGIKPAMDKVKAVKDFPEPQSVRQVREFIGLTNYFRKHIKNFALLSGQLSILTRKDAEWKGGPLPAPAKAAFEQIKLQLISAPVLAYPMRDRPYILAVDAATGTDESPGGLGAILSQIDPTSQLERVISYASRGLKDFEKNYTPFLLEMAACVWSVEHFHVYLYGRKFTLLTDHMPVEKASKTHQKTFRD
jgi:hypothetical protein